MFHGTFIHIGNTWPYNNIISERLGHYERGVTVLPYILYIVYTSREVCIGKDGMDDNCGRKERKG